MRSVHDQVAVIIQCRDVDRRENATSSQLGRDPSQPVLLDELVLDELTGVQQ